ncbi:hypothetical protein Gogos_020808 [Gossypium gossypioides]|uniref:DUF4283 domain-containing protein n=1 Tax=Gossypium gossypioides TaxID=34282 RepID=A0A7J9CZB4_GOSGO|nr:hypothetical protein [Gossypium gossypioides]
MEDELANLSLLDDEEEAFQEEEGAVDCAYQFCLVGRCLTDSVVHFPSLRNTMADLWHLIGGICITELGEKQYLFQFFHEVDIEKVVAGTPWFFNNHLLILQRIPIGENPTVLKLNLTEFWIQVHELLPGLMTESMVKQFGDFCGKFIKYDTFIPSLGLKKYMRIHVCLDVSVPLKHKKKVLVGKSMIVYARFKYEKLSLFCFICRKLGHGESYYPFRLKYHGTSRQNKGHDWGKDDLVTDGLVYGPMDLVLEEENDPIAMLDGKKRQRIVESPRVLLDANVGTSSMDVSASTGDQSSRAR